MSALGSSTSDVFSTSGTYASAQLSPPPHTNIATTDINQPNKDKIYLQNCLTFNLLSYNPFKINKKLEIKLFSGLSGLIGLIVVIARLSYSDHVAGAVACPVYDAQKPGGSSLPCSIANTKPNNVVWCGGVVA